MILFFLLVCIPAFADAPVIWSGNTAKWLPAGLNSAGICSIDSSGVITSLSPGTSGNLLTSNGSAWVSSAPAASWLQAGNSGTTAGTNFLGTTDAQDIVIKRNSAEVARGTATGFKVTGAFSVDAFGSGLVKATSDVFGLATSGTDYAPATSGSAILKGNGAGGFSSAVSGTDYAPATSGSSILKGNGAGGFSNAAAGTDYEVPLTFSTGLTRATNTITVNSTQNITKLSNLTSNGYVKTSGSDGTLSVQATPIPVTDGGTGTNTQFTANSVVYAGASGVYTESNSNFNYNPSTGALKTPRLTLAPAATNQGIINWTNLAASRSGEFGVQGNGLYLDWGGISYLYMLNGWTSFSTSTAPVWSFDFGQAATSTNIITDVIRNSGAFNLPVVMSKNTSATANNYSGFIFAGASTASTAMDAGIFAIHEAHTNGAESARMEFYNRNAGTLARSMAIAKDKTITMDKYGAGVCHFDASGVISSSAVALASDVSGTLPVANGGTGQTSYTDGQLLIGNSSGNTLTKATLTAGSGITVTNGGGSITIAASGGGGASSDYRCYDDSGGSGGGNGSTNTTVAYFQNLTGSSGSSITETNNNSTSGLELTIATAGNYCANWTTNYSNANIDFAVTVNSTQLTTSPGSGSFNGLNLVAGANGRAVSANVHYSVAACQYFAVNDVIRPQSTASPGRGSDNTAQRFCLRRMN